MFILNKDMTKTSKDYCCDGCRTTIKSGQAYWEFIASDYFPSCKYCKNCHVLAKNIGEFFNDSDIDEFDTSMHEAYGGCIYQHYTKRELYNDMRSFHAFRDLKDDYIAGICGL